MKKTNSPLLLFFDYIIWFSFTVFLAIYSFFTVKNANFNFLMSWNLWIYICKHKFVGRKFDVASLSKSVSIYEEKNILKIIIPIQPQWTVDKNLGSDRLADSKSLDPNHWRQPILWLQDFFVVHGKGLCLF